MPYADLPLDELRAYQPDLAVPADLRDFWDTTLAQTHSHALDARFDRVDSDLRLLDVYDVTFSEFGGHPIKGWLKVAAGATGPLPAVVHFVGYGGGRGLGPQVHRRPTAS